MSRKSGFVIALILVFGYFLIKYAIGYTHSKFGQGLNYVALPVLYFGPAFLFLLSMYLLSLPLPANRRSKQLLLSAIISIGACLFAHSFYDSNSLVDYFDELNTGYSYPKAEDFRLEYFILFVANILSFLFLIKRKK